MDSHCNEEATALDGASPTPMEKYAETNLLNHSLIFIGPKIPN